jgi:CheY-like chemotaxis protein
LELSFPHRDAKGARLMEKEKQLVLVAEDQAVNREILKTILQSEYQVIETENGAAALAELERHKDIAAILLDIVMPVMNGYEVLERLRNSPFSSIPTIVMTGETDKSSEQKALDLGAWDFVSKPYRPATLLHAAEKRHRAQPVLSRQSDEIRL